MTIRLRAEDRPRIVWLLALLLFMLGCRTIASRESSIAKASVATEELVRRIRANDRAMADAVTLRRSEQLAWADLTQISGGQQPAVSVAGFLRGLERLAGRLQLAVVSVTPSESTAPKTARTALLPMPITVLVQGRFRSLVRFMQEATRQKTLIGLDSAQLMVSSLPAARAFGLDATIRVTLYRLMINAADAPAN